MSNSEHNKIQITEVCPRDGFQTIDEFIDTDRKIHIINEMVDIGFEQIEVTSFVHPRAIPQLKDAANVLENIKREKNVKFRALVPNVIGLNRAIESKVDKVKLMLSATDSHSISNANKKTFDVLEEHKRVIEKAHSANMPVSGSISVAFGCPFEGKPDLERILKIVEIYSNANVNEVSLADTAGMANPKQVKYILKELNNKFPNVNFTLHLHNTRGLAFANAVAGIESGVTGFDTSLAGIGGCPYIPKASGNIATEDLVHGLHEMDIETGLDIDKILKISKKLESEFSEYTHSYLLKAGKNSELVKAPDSQIKVIKN